MVHYATETGRRKQKGHAGEKKSVLFTPAINALWSSLNACVMTVHFPSKSQFSQSLPVSHLEFSGRNP